MDGDRAFEENTVYRHYFHESRTDMIKAVLNIFQEETQKLTAMTTINIMTI